MVPGALSIPDMLLPSINGKRTGATSMIQEVRGDKELRGGGHGPPTRSCSRDAGVEGF